MAFASKQRPAPRKVLGAKSFHSMAGTMDQPTSVGGQGRPASRFFGKKGGGEVRPGKEGRPVKTQLSRLIVGVGLLHHPPDNRA